MSAVVYEELEGLVESLSCLKGYENFEYPKYHLEFPVCGGLTPAGNQVSRN